MNTDLWIFGYGSLVWRPAFPYRQRRPGYVRGYARRFWQESTDHRGTPEAPGRVVTLIPAADVQCWGTAYQVEPDQVDEVLSRLDHREQQGYERIDVAVHLLPEANVSGGSHDQVQAVMYVASAQNPHYVGEAALADIAAIIRTCHGPSGSNHEYLLRLANALAAMGADDPHVFELARVVTENDPPAGE